MEFKIINHRKSQFAVCIDNKGYSASLERGKLYRVLPDKDAALHGYLRIIDDSGEDYAYASARFFPPEIPQGLEQFLTKASTAPLAR